MKVRVEDGNSFGCDIMVEGFKWKMWGLVFIVDLIFMFLGGCDIVLGV